jgi:uncharacterized membrane protein YfcA
VEFPISGIECPAFLPPLAGFCVAALTSAGGLSGAFLLLPFQVSVLGFTTPAVTPTNLLFNIVAAPGGVYGYAAQRRMHWPLAWTLIAGTLPGIFLGALIRIRYLPDPRSFKFFVGCVLLYVGARLLMSVRRPLPCDEDAPVEEQGRRFNRLATAVLAVAVGLVGGIYGIGGGAIIAPFLVAVLHMPVCAVAGSALLTTFVTSAAGVGAFELIAQLGYGVPVRPDWALGALFGAGGLAGTYTGARLQKHLPERWLRLGLGLLVGGLALSYIVAFFLR